MGYVQQEGDRDLVKAEYMYGHRLVGPLSENQTRDPSGLRDRRFGQRLSGPHTNRHRHLLLSVV